MTAPPRRMARAIPLIAALILAIVVAIFVGFNLSHREMTQERQQGQVPAREQPQGPRDLVREPAAPR